MKTKFYLVEVCLKDWKPSLNDTRIIGYEEVEAYDEVSARYIAHDQFSARMKYEPILRRKMQSANITSRDICTPNAVEID